MKRYLKFQFKIVYFKPSCLPMGGAKQAWLKVPPPLNTSYKYFLHTLITMKIEVQSKSLKQSTKREETFFNFKKCLALISYISINKI